jgi:hypothetical protein
MKETENHLLHSADDFLNALVLIAINNIFVLHFRVLSECQTSTPPS